MPVFFVIARKVLLNSEFITTKVLLNGKISPKKCKFPLNYHPKNVIYYNGWY